MTASTKITSLLALGFVGFSAALNGVAHASPAPSAAEAGLLAAEDRLFAAEAHHDAATAAPGFADEASFVHANGKVQTKSQYLQGLGSGGPPVSSVTASDRVVRIFGKVGVIRGVKTVVIGDLRLPGSYLAVYLWREGRWQMLDEQSSPAFRPAPPK
ncbi:MAG: nuclear transport factor 2 family protein [Caulobacteraceae bacterium]